MKRAQSYCVSCGRPQPVDLNGACLVCGAVLPAERSFQIFKEIHDLPGFAARRHQAMVEANAAPPAQKAVPVSLDRGHQLFAALRAAVNSKG